jgi:acetolactate synthase-1/2/3 large subunit
MSRIQRRGATADLCTALDQEGVSIIACPVDYAQNLRLADAVGQLDGAL